MHWSLKTIIALISVLCYLSEIEAAKNQTLAKNVTRVPQSTDHRKYFVRRLQSLARLSNGMFVQSELSEQYVNITAQFMGCNAAGLNALQKLRPSINQTVVDIEELQRSVRALNLSDHFLLLNKIRKLFDRVMQIIKLLTFGPTKGHVLMYLQKLSEMKNANYKYEFMNFTNLNRLNKCLVNDIPTLRSENCQEILQNIANFTGDIIKEVDGLKHFTASFPHAQDVTIELLRMNRIWKSIAVAHSTFPLTDKLNAIGSILNESESDLKLVEPVVKAQPSLKELDAIAKLISTFSSVKENGMIPAFSHGVRSLEQLFADLEHQSMKYSISGGKSLESLKKGLVPLKKYKDQLLALATPGKRLETWTPQAINYSVFENMNGLVIGLRKWKESGTFSLPKTFVEPIRKCVKDVAKQTSQFNTTYFNEVGRFFNKLNEQIAILADAVNNITDSKVSQVLNETAEIISKNLSGVDLNNDEALRVGMTNAMSALYFSKTLNRLWKPFEASKVYKAADLMSLLENHPNLTLMEQSIAYVDFDNILGMYRCLANNGYSYQSDIIVWGRNLSTLVMDKNSNGTAIYLNELSRTLGLIEEGKKTVMPKSKEIDQINVFGRSKDVTQPLAMAWPEFQKVSDVLDRAKLFREAVELKVGDNSTFWKRWAETGRLSVQEMLKQLEDLDHVVSNSSSRGLGSIARVLDRASKLRGVSVDWDGLNETSPTIQEKFKNISELDLKFSSYSRHFGEAAVRVTVMKTFFDDFFGIKPKETVKLFSHPVVEQRFPVLTVVLLVVGSLLVFLFLACVLYSLTCGRNWWKKKYLENFGSPETLELYWRYSYWTDQESEKNELCEAVREINYEQVRSLIRSGAFINVYNSFGNTPLHAATKYGHAKIVEVLIKNGADRYAYNYENKIPEQLIFESIALYVPPPGSASEKTGRKSTEQLKIEKIYKKHKTTKFGQRIPDLLPTMDFRIRLDTKIKNKTVDEFIEFYKGNVTDQMAGVTHLIVPTDKNGVFISDDFGYIMCVFLPTLLMKEQWMRACLEKKSNFRDDYKFRVEKVRYKGKEHGTVLKWAQWVHKQTLPFLFGVQLHLCAEVGEAVSSQLRQLVEMHGATWCEEVPVKEQYNIGSHPFHHFHLGPLFVIHSNNVPSMEYLKNDDMYTLMTFDGFVEFMLKMEVKYDVLRRLPIPVVSKDPGAFPMDDPSVNASNLVSTNMVSNRSSTDLTSKGSSTNLNSNASSTNLSSSRK